MGRFLLLVGLLLAGCAGTVDPCTVDGGVGALSTCLAPTLDSPAYADQGLRYFDTLESGWDGEEGPDYAPGVARWEWPPWLKLTGYGREDLEAVDAIVRLIPTSVPTRECLFFERQPFVRCRVSFRYEDEPDRACPIYEEFTYNDAGETTFIEAWSDDPAVLPSGPDDPWAEGDDAVRLSTRIPGLGSARGVIDLDSPAMAAAAAADEDVADFVTRARDFYGTWLAEYQAAGPEVFAEGCGW